MKPIFCVLQLCTNKGLQLLVPIRFPSTFARRIALSPRKLRSQIVDNQKDRLEIANEEAQSIFIHCGARREGTKNYNFEILLREAFAKRDVNRKPIQYSLASSSTFS